MASASLDWTSLDAVSAEVGDAFYVYDEAMLQGDITDITDAVSTHLASVRFHYAYKANFTPAICRAIAAMGWGAEVDSPMLLWLAQRLGVPTHDIVYNGIARDPTSVREAMLAGVLVTLDADRDVAVALQAAQAAGEHPVRVAIRLHSPTAAYPAPRLGRTPPQVREAIAALSAQPNIALLGLTSHTPDPSVEGVRTRVHDLVTWSAEFFPEGPRIIGVGGASVSRGTSLADGYAAAAELIATELRRMSWGSAVTVLFEPGVSAVADAFEYVARVVDVKEQPGRTVINVAGSIYHTSPNTRSVDFPVRVVASSDRGTTPDLRLVGGATAVDGDWLSVDLPCETQVQPGDFLVFSGVGAYSVSMGTHFTEPLPAVMRRQGDAWTVVRARPTFSETLVGFDLG